MSLGYCGIAKIYDQDEDNIYYLYSGENWNEPTSSKDDRYLYDGLIRINKAAFKDGKGTDYICYMSNGIKAGKIEVMIECKNAFIRYKNFNFDYIAHRIILRIFEKFQESRAYPEEVGFIQ
ncbi:hypothetical protein [Clostridium sp.]|uniref:hypothetical protein n=1 Tax=Clostridium sp. TaxID=1506 RepID=UPI0032177BB7